MLRCRPGSRRPADEQPCLLAGHGEQQALEAVDALDEDPVRVEGIAAHVEAHRCQGAIGQACVALAGVGVHAMALERHQHRDEIGCTLLRRVFVNNYGSSPIGDPVGRKSLSLGAHPTRVARIFSLSA